MVRSVLIKWLLSWLARRDPDQADADSIGSLVLQILAGVLFSFFAAGGVIVFVAWLDGMPLRDIPHWVLALIFGAAAAVPLLISLLFLLGRMAQRRRAKQLGITALGGACSYEDGTQASWAPEVARDRTIAALQTLPQGSEVEAIDGGEIIAITGKTDRSFGERVHILIEPLPRGGCALRVRSRPKVTQFFDAGINASNVVRIMEHLRYGLGEAKAEGPQESAAGDRTAGRIWELSALAILVMAAGYTGLLIYLLELRPAVFDLWASIQEDLALSPTQWMGVACATMEGAVGQKVSEQLNVMILPLVLFYASYNCAQFRSGRERMSGTDWILCIGSLGALPVLVMLGCLPGWEEGMTSRYRGLVSFMTRESAGAVVYAVGLVVFCNGVSYLPALALARLTSPRLPTPNR